jgi:peroxiredoxin
MKRLLSSPRIAMVLVVAVAFMLSCNNTGDTPITYDQFVEGFPQRFEEIEVEYESADKNRQSELDLIYEALELELVEAQKAYIRVYPDSLRSVSLLYEIDWSFKSNEEFWSYLHLIDTSLHGNEDYIRLCEFLEQSDKVQVGKFAPDFEMNDKEGIPRSLSEAIKGAEYLLLDFWASTCGPCRLENPNILKTYEDFNTKGFDVFGVSTDTKKESWLSAVEKDGLSWTNVCSLEAWNKNEVVRIYALSQVSQNFLLDKSGKIIARDLRGEDLDKMLASLMR